MRLTDMMRNNDLILLRAPRTLYPSKEIWSFFIYVRSPARNYTGGWAASVNGVPMQVRTYLSRDIDFHMESFEIDMLKLFYHDLTIGVT